MGVLQYFDVLLEDNPSGVYFPGDVVKGRIKYGLEEEQKTKGVRVEFEGKAKVAFTKRKGAGKTRRIRTYTDSETYFKEVSHVVGDGSSEEHLAAGEYSYPFQFQLPQNIPSSYIGEHGRVAYSVKGVIDRPWKFDHEAVTFFSVICNYDLNIEGRKELAMAPLNVSDEKFFCCFCCKSGPVSASARSDRTGYVPGEKVIVTLMVDNKSNILIKPIRVMLLQKTVFKANKFLGTMSESKTSMKGLSMIESAEHLQPGESESYPDIVFKIPALPPSELEFCTKIDISYSIQVEVPPKGCHITLEVPLPLIIGTIPLQSVALNLNHEAVSGSVWRDTTPGELSKEEKGANAMKAFFTKKKDDDEPQAATSRPSDPPIQNLYPDLPLPTYEEALDMPTGDQDAPTMREEADNEHITGNWDFKPIYPYYG